MYFEPHGPAVAVKSLKTKFGTSGESRPCQDHAYWQVQVESAKN